MSDWGGVRTPATPAPVSGPGAMSARTDGGVMNPNAPAYGENLELQNLQSQAPVAGSAGAPASPGGAPVAAGGPTAIPLGAPSQDGRPVTAGAAAGAGPGLEALGIPTDPMSEKLADQKALDPGLVKALIAASMRGDATPSFRRMVRSVLYK